MVLRAFAKINLDLRILGRRPDGYHEVRTILQTIDWSDEIHIDQADRFEFIAHGISGGHDNLVVRAWRAFQRLTGEEATVRIELFKHIPVGAGLGGGSSDAAVTLLGLQRLFARELPTNDLFEAMSGLGSDVPFFAWGGRAMASGRGDQIMPLADEPDSWIILVDPGVFISTAQAYSWLTVPDKSNSIMGFCAQSVPGHETEPPGNDFESAVFAHHPRLADIKKELLAAGALSAALSGSGSAIFGIFGSERAALKALPALAPYGNARVIRLLPRSEYSRRIWGVAKW